MAPVDTYPNILASLHRILPTGIGGASGQAGILQLGVPGAGFTPTFNSSGPPTKAGMEPAHLHVLREEGVSSLLKDQ